MNKPENKMLLAVLDVSKKEGENIYFKTRPFGLNSIDANLRDGKLYIEIKKWPREEKVGNVEIEPRNENDVPF